LQFQIAFRMKNFRLIIASISVAVLSFASPQTPYNDDYTPFEETDSLVSVIGVGDIMLGSNYPTAAKLPPNDGRDLLRNVKDILADADLTFGNLEGCILDEGGTPKPCKSHCYFFRMPDRYVNHLLDAGFDVMNIANNHNGDFGQKGRENTVKVLKEAGLHYAGLKNECETDTFTIDGVKYGFCGFAPNSGTVQITDLAYAKALVAGLDSLCDIVIVSFHGGAEGKAYNRVPKRTENYLGQNRGDVHAFAHAVIDVGADVVLGHGPHVVRAAELYKDRFIAYSMGNFCTSGDFNINGACGYAPIVKVFTDKTGKFVKGQIVSCLQKDKNGPVIDSAHTAAKEIRRLTLLDFPQSGLTISEDGQIEPSEKPTASDYKETLFDLPACLADEIIEYSKQFLGCPYRRGSTGPKRFDCSGFTSYVFKKFGYNLSRDSRSQALQGIPLNTNELRTGDLVFFKGRNSRSKRIGHVGIVVSNDDGRFSFIHACFRGVRIDALENSDYYKQRYVTGLRVLDESIAWNRKPEIPIEYLTPDWKLPIQYVYPPEKKLTIQ